MCTEDHMTNLQEKFQKMDIVDHCTRRRANNRWKFYELTNNTVLASSLKDLPMGWEDTELPEAFSENHNINCLTFEKHETTLQ